jgi:small subunit ribosomal protein S18
MTDEMNRDNRGERNDEIEVVEEGQSERSPRGGMRRRLSNQKLVQTDVQLYKDVELLRRFLTDRGQIRPRRQTGLRARDQRRLSIAVKRARHLALLPFTGEIPRDNN